MANAAQQQGQVLMSIESRHLDDALAEDACLHRKDHAIHRCRLERRIAFAALVSTLVAAQDVSATASAAVAAQADWDPSGSLFWSSDNGAQTITYGGSFDFQESSVVASDVTVNDTQLDAKQFFQPAWTDMSASSTFSGVQGAASGLGSTSDAQMVAASDATTHSGRFESRGYSAHIGRFIVHGGPGNITFTFPYSYQILLQKDLIADEAAAGTISPRMSLDNYGNNPAATNYRALTSVYDFSTYHSFGTGFGNSMLNTSIDENDNIALTLLFNDGDHGYFSIAFDTYAFANSLTAPVPLPGAAVLLGSGLLGISAIRKKRT